MSLSHLSTSGWLLLAAVLSIALDVVYDVVSPSLSAPILNPGATRSRWHPLVLGALVTYVLWLMTP